MVTRFFSAKLGSVFLSCWLAISCLSGSAIAGNDSGSDNAESTPIYSQEDDSWIFNAQTIITLAPYIFMIPKVRLNYMDEAAGKEQDYQWTIGVKWQIDF